MKALKPLLAIAVMASIFTACTQPAKVVDTAAPVQLKGVIGLETARRLVQNYNVRANKVHKGELLMPDARCVWFSLEQLQALMANIKSEGGDGIRFYLAAYDKKTRPDISKINPAYLDYTTLVMVSTTLDSSGKHFDYYKSRNAKGSMLMAEPQNQGEMCPPPQKCDNIGAGLLDTLGKK